MRHLTLNKSAAAAAVLAFLGAMVWGQSGAMQGDSRAPGAAASKPASRPGAASAPASMHASGPAATSGAAAASPAWPTITSITFKCEKCGKEFAVKPSEMANTMRRDCPVCNANKGCWIATQCPACHKFFIAASTKVLYGGLAVAESEFDNVHDVCPYCKTDLQDWWKNHQPK